jgi:hypothetical protein
MLSMTRALFALLTIVPALAAAKDPAWDAERAAARLDARARLWTGSDQTRRSHDTTCVSCHSAMPYLLVRPLLRDLLVEREPSEPEKLLLEDVRRRVALWNEVEPWYSRTEDKIRESRGTEAVLNAFVLASLDRTEKKSAPSETTRLAIENLWQEQKEDGRFAWLHFSLAPWETDESDFFGACLAGVAVSSVDAPDGGGKDRLARYLRSSLDRDMNLHSRLGLLWVSARWPGLLDAAERRALLEKVLSVQRPDGGFRLGDLGAWKRKPEAADGYATGLAVHVLGELGDGAAASSIERGLDWLASHQQASGGWLAESVNSDRMGDDAFVSGFMSDAATAFAVLALARR